ncbi:MAG: hypothetical protein GY765_11040 [bacterium]|nr:hypothetical protein [bacterium]
MRIRLYYILFFFAIFFTAVHSSSAAFFEDISANGRLRQYVSCTLQDRENFIWIGTYSGLIRYDGYHFTWFKHDPEIHGSISNNRIMSIAEDLDGRLWIGTQDGLNRFDRDKEAFVPYRHKPGDSRSLSHNDINKVLVDKQGTVWVATYGGGLNRFRKSTGTFKVYKHAPGKKGSISHNIVNALHEDNSGNLWVGTLQGLNLLDRRREFFTCFTSAPGNPMSLSHNNVLSIFRDRKNILWVGTENGLNAVSVDFKEVRRYRHDGKIKGSVSNNTISTLFQDSAGVLWVGTSDGLNKWDPRTRGFVHYRYHPNKTGSIASDTVTWIFEDRQGILWFSTNGGLSKLNRGKTSFEHFFHIPGHPNSISNNMVFSFYEEETETGNILWLGTFNGLNRYDKEKNEFRHFVHEPGNPKSLSNNGVRCIHKGKDGIFWLGTSNGLNRFDSGSGEFTHYKHRVSGAESSAVIMAIHQSADRPGVLWLAGDGMGIMDFHIKTGRFRYYPEEGSKRNALTDPVNPSKSVGHFSAGREKDRRCIRGEPVDFPNCLVFGFHESPGDNSLWVGTYGKGLYQFDREKKQFRCYRHIPGNTESLGNNNVRVIHESESEPGILWLGTDNGINRFNPEQQVFTTFNEKDGLVYNTVYGILEDQIGRLWISTGDGLSQFDPAERRFNNYFAADGLQNNAFTHHSYYKNAAGEMYFGGINGYNRFLPKKPRRNTNVPAIAVTGFKLLNKDVKIGRVLKRSIIETDALFLSDRDNIFTFEFAALDFTAPEKNRYAFKMDGISEGWMQLGTKRDVGFAGLPPGDYVFHVKACNNDNVWNETGRSIRIRIAPPFWKTWWAYCFYVCLLFLCALSVHKLRVRQLKKRKEELKIQVANRTEQLMAANRSLKRANKEISNINDSLSDTNREKTQINRNLKQSMQELSRANLEMKKANCLKNEFLGIAAHDLKNPLQVILGYTFLLKGKATDLMKDNREVEAINKSVEKMLRLISELLETAALESGKVQPTISEMNLARLAQSVVNDNTAIAGKKGQKIVFSSSLNSLIYSDKMELRQVLDNLISNAIKYSPHGKTIWVDLVDAGDDAIIRVKDEGPGLTAGDKKNLFRQFHRLSARPTAGESSTGLGLSICKRMLDILGGDIHVESEVKQGSTFIVKLPKMGRRSNPIARHD